MGKRLVRGVVNFPGQTTLVVVVVEISWTIQHEESLVLMRIA